MAISHGITGEITRQVARTPCVVWKVLSTTCLYPYQHFIEHAFSILPKREGKNKHVLVKADIYICTYNIAHIIRSRVTYVWRNYSFSCCLSLIISLSIYFNTLTYLTSILYLFMLQFQTNNGEQFTRVLQLEWGRIRCWYKVKTVNSTLSIEFDVEPFDKSIEIEEYWAWSRIEISIRALKFDIKQHMGPIKHLLSVQLQSYQIESLSFLQKWSQKIILLTILSTHSFPPYIGATPKKW